jgi:4-hydroxy-2-oxoheptanedioate aldolase
VNDNAHRKVRERGVLRFVNPDYPSPALVEFLGKAGFDAVFLDCEHQFASVGQIQHMTRAAHHAGMLAFVRPEMPHPSIMIRYLDTGADGLIIPHVETAEEGRAVVAAVQEAFWRDEDRKYIILMLESVEAIARADEIIGVEGITGVMIGPMDLSQSMGFPGQPRHPDVRKAFDRIVPKIHAAGLLAGAPIDYPGVMGGSRDGGFITSIHARVLLGRACEAHLGQFAE